MIKSQSNFNISFRGEGRRRPTGPNSYSYATSRRLRRFSRGGCRPHPKYTGLVCRCTRMGCLLVCLCCRREPPSTPCEKRPRWVPATPCEENSRLQLVVPGTPCEENSRLVPATPCEENARLVPATMDKNVPCELSEDELAQVCVTFLGIKYSTDIWGPFDSRNWLLFQIPALAWTIMFLGTLDLVPGCFLNKLRRGDAVGSLSALTQNWERGYYYVSVLPTLLNKIAGVCQPKCESLLFCRPRLHFR